MSGRRLALALGLPAAALLILFGVWLQLRSLADAPAVADGDADPQAREAARATGPERVARQKPLRPQRRLPPQRGAGLEARIEPAPEPARDALGWAAPPRAELEIEAPEDPGAGPAAAP